MKRETLFFKFLPVLSIAETPGDDPGDVQHVLANVPGLAARIIPERNKHAV